jgi:cobalt-zinc-cadmium resistance protein CzcA
MSTGIGSQVQKPLAVVVAGGMTVAPLVILIVLPALISLFSRRRMVADAAESAFEPAE